MLTNFHGNEAKKNFLLTIFKIARIGQNFDDYPGFQQIPYAYTFATECNFYVEAKLV